MKEIGIAESYTVSLSALECFLNWTHLMDVLFLLVRAVGVEPARIAAQEPKGDVTLVKAFMI